ncbi:MAG: SRPBCC domain-containing protein [Planctomycetes bacterium]|nr:SRPBCC domain-containing protein [Planctomycetota bacterium]
MARKPTSSSTAESKPEVENRVAVAPAASITPTEVRRSVVVKAAVESLFGALTDASQLQRWLCEAAKLEPKANGKVSLTFGANSTLEGKITEFAPGERVTMSLTPSGSKSAKLALTVDLRVRGEGAGARVTLTETGLADADAVKAADRGWAHRLERLRSLFEDGAEALRGTEEVATIPVSGESPYGVAWDGKHLWHTDASAGKLIKFDPTSGKVLAEFDVGGGPTGVDSDGKDLWVLDPKRKAILQVDPGSGEVKRRLRVLRVAGDLTDVAWDGKSLWVGMTGEGGKIVRIDSRTGMAQGSLPSPEVPSGVAVDRKDGAHLWVAAVRSRVVTRIDSRKGTIVDRFGLRGEPAGLAWDGECLWHTDLEARALVRVRPLVERTS